MISKKQIDKKRITVYFTPISFEVELDDNLGNEEIEEEINRQVYDLQADEITNDVDIDYWEY